MTLFSWRATAMVTAFVAIATVTVGAGQVSAMTGGSPVLSSREAPWEATLALKGSQPLLQRASCGGVLVAPNKVLTAAHCIAGIPEGTLSRIAEYHIGARVLSRDPGYLADIAGVQIDPLFRLLPSPVDPTNPSADSAAHDIAVITLDRDVTEVPTLPIAEREPRNGTVALFYGHGVTGATSGVSDVLRRGMALLDRDSACARDLPGVQIDATSMRCGWELDAEACDGDSGGPWVSWQYGLPEVVGIFSFGNETVGKACGTPGPGFFTDTVVTRPWIERQLV